MVGLTPNINRSVSQIVGRLGLMRGDKYGLTNGWFLDTRNGRTIVRYQDKCKTAEQIRKDVENIADALTSRGYTVVTTGTNVEVVR